MSVGYRIRSFFFRVKLNAAAAAGDIVPSDGVFFISALSLAHGAIFCFSSKSHKNKNLNKFFFGWLKYINMKKFSLLQMLKKIYYENDMISSQKNWKDF